MKINILIGAGFSLEAGYPSGRNINESFFSNVENKILRQSDSQWMWDEHGSAASNNGRLNFDHLNISYLLSELVELFQKELYQTFDYEEFYDWFLSKYNDNELIKLACGNVNNRLRNELRLPATSKHYFKHPDINQYRTILEAYNYLIADRLQGPYKSEEKMKYYHPFIDFIKQNESTKIFTLNHDTLVEFLFHKYSVEYSDGFSIDDSRILGENDVKLPMFTNSFLKKNRLFKLHGSINYYVFNEMSQQGGIYYDTGNYWFFKPRTYWDKEGSHLIDPVSGSTVQSLKSNILPQFLTGKHKRDTIVDHFFYKHLYEHFYNSFQDTERLVIIGYSFRDNHINEIIKKAIDNYSFDIVNVNPSGPFPFRRGYSRETIIQYNSIEELSNLLQCETKL
jgi:SIR2-like domain